MKRIIFKKLFCPNNSGLNLTINFFVCPDGLLQMNRLHISCQSSQGQGLNFLKTGIFELTVYCIFSLSYRKSSRFLIYHTKITLFISRCHFFNKDTNNRLLRKLGDQLIKPQNNSFSIVIFPLFDSRWQTAILIKSRQDRQ